MTAIQKVARTTQMVLFGEQLHVPHWSDLAEKTRIEAVTLLAQLLVEVRTSNLVLQERGGGDE